MRDAIGQRFDILFVGLPASRKFTVEFTVDHRAIDIEATTFHLHRIAGQTDKALDVIRPGNRRLTATPFFFDKLEHDDIAAIWHAIWHPTIIKVWAHRQRMLGIPICPFGNEQMVTDQQR